VTVVEYLDRLVPTMDLEVGKMFERVLAKQGIKTKLKTKVTGATKGADGVTLTLEPAAGGAAETLKADVVLLASGTATLEAALLQRPMVISYRMPRLSWWIMNSRRYQPWVGLPNILAGEFVVPELLQDAATPDALAAAVIDLLQDKAKREAIEQRFAVMAAELRQNAAERAAAAVLAELRGGR